ncbi:MAG: hypothetical protein COA80_13000, partial [Leeuwenhoekiella sp.]
MKTKKNEENTYNSDLTQLDKDILNQKNIHKDGGADEQLRDRAKDVIISGGENISSQEVEKVIMEHPSVMEVCIVG